VCQVKGCRHVQYAYVPMCAHDSRLANRWEIWRWDFPLSASGRVLEGRGSPAIQAKITTRFMHNLLFFSCILIMRAYTTCAEGRLGRLIIVHTSVPIMRTPIALHNRPPEKVT